MNIVNRVDSHIRIYNRNAKIEINIHKSVIEEQLNDIEENKKQNDKLERESHGMIKRIINNFI